MVWPKTPRHSTLKRTTNRLASTVKVVFRLRSPPSSAIIAGARITTPVRSETTQPTNVWICRISDGIPNTPNVAPKSAGSSPAISRKKVIEERLPNRPPSLRFHSAPRTPSADVPVATATERAPERVNDSGSIRLPARLTSKRTGQARTPSR
ncbi:hypothetical protein SDC9_195136 [bioreactor metagenome]|uniref:Uncharacterized protein n=1 Tax=bioreactor metagenome TaxID=1076179 RepID=A0A645IJM9_9ZZZZ